MGREEAYRKQGWPAQIQDLEAEEVPKPKGKDTEWCGEEGSGGRGEGVFM